MLDRICGYIVKKTGKMLHLPTYEIFYSIEQTLDGKVISKTGRRRAKSWTRNAYNNLFTAMAWVNNTGASFGAGSLSYISTAGANQNYATCVNIDGAIVTAAGVVTGIIIGTDNTAFSFEHHNLLGKIAEGQGVGQVNYGQCFASPTQASGSPTMSHSYLRYFNNNSNGDITLGEIGIDRAGRLVCRDVISPAETFLDKAQLRVEYIISLTFPY